MYDVIIANGEIVDGSGQDSFYADIGIKDGKIVAIGLLGELQAQERIDASGKVVAPGFIDIHCHSDSILFKKPQEVSKILQGVTTETIGNCGLSAAPVNPATLALLQKYTSAIFADGMLPWDWRSTGEFLARIEQEQPIGNVAALVGHGTVRIAVMGFDNRYPTPAEQAQMRCMVRESLAEGAFGLSSGLIYPPGVFSDEAEMIDLCREVAAVNGLYATHMRNEGTWMLEAVAETLRVSRQTGVAVEISHHKSAGQTNWGKVNQSLCLMEQAQSDGVAVHCDVYPYIASSTVLSAVLPPWMHEGGAEAMLERLAAPEHRNRVKQEFVSGLNGWDRFATGDNWQRIVVASCGTHHEYEGKSLADLAQSRGQQPADALFDILLEERGDVLMMAFLMCEEDVQRILRHPLSMVGSDAIPSQGKPHPRFYGTFPRILRKYVREEKVLTLSEAVRKMSALPAQKLGLRDRGLLQTNMVADIVVFDKELVADCAKYDDPCHYATGVDTVLVNGHAVVKNGEFTGKTAGKVLRKS
jgi:N-acyl-D-amino-acid deacylase